jgi:hypothetical protein
VADDPNRAEAMRLFIKASGYAIAAGFDNELHQQRAARLEDVTESDLLREAAWVVLCSGFREATVRQCFRHVSLCFCDWESAASIVESYPACKFAAKRSFSNDAKLEAIVGIARHIAHEGFVSFKKAILLSPIDTLQRLPYIGPVTVWHLAKNIGLDAAKPDRHLVRVSSRLGFPDAASLCAEIASVTGEPVSVVDLIIWRFLADNIQRRRQWL